MHRIPTNRKVMFLFISDISDRNSLICVRIGEFLFNSTFRKPWPCIFYKISDTPRTEVFCRKIPAECSVHHELYHQVSSYPDCKTRDLLPSILLKVMSSNDLVNEWTDFVDINNQGTQVNNFKLFPSSQHKWLSSWRAQYIAPLQWAYPFCWFGGFSFKSWEFSFPSPFLWKF